MAELLTVGVRALAKSKTYSIINIAGLAIGMAACIMILLYIRYEQSYDQWLPDAENIYQFQTWYQIPRDRRGSPSPDGVLRHRASGCKKDFPQVESGGLHPRQRAGLPQGRPGDRRPKTIIFADDDFLKVVNLPLVARHARCARASNTAVITQAEAIKRFGTDQVVGRTLTVISRGEKRDFKITGVLKDLPKNSHMKINAIAAPRLHQPSMRTSRSS